MIQKKLKSIDTTSEQDGKIDNTCDYKSYEDLNKEPSLSRNNSNLIIGHINTRSMINKLEQITHLLKETKVHVLSINESWLNENNYMKIKINNFYFIGKNRNSRGEVGFLIKKYLLMKK